MKCYARCAACYLHASSVSDIPERKRVLRQPIPLLALCAMSFWKILGPAPLDSWMGQSYGYWQDTLVVEVSRA